MLNEADTCTRYVVPRLREAGWDSGSHSFNEQQLIQFTDGRIVMAGNRVRRRPPKRADYLLKYTRDFTIAVVEAKSEDCTAGDGLQQAKDYADTLGLKFAYENKRVEGRSIVFVDEQKANNVRLIFDLYAYQNCTIDAVVQRLADGHIKYSDDAPGWCRAKVHNILRDRAYIGEIRFKGQWYPGSQQPVVPRPVWDRVQSLLGGHSYKSHELTYAGALIRCGHCDNLITGESVVKKQTGKEYVYYRCTMYKSVGHPPIRLTEASISRS